MTHMRILVNVVCYQCAWFACVLGAAAGRPEIGLAVVVAIVAWHLRSARAPLRELMLVAIAAVVGAVFETLLIVSGWVNMAPALLTGNITPLWMVALWAAFATTLNVSLRALRARYGLAALLGAVGAPLAYYAGAALGALQWVEAMPALLAIGVAWALLTPLLMKSAQRFDGFASP